MSATFSTAWSRARRLVPIWIVAGAIACLLASAGAAADPYTVLVPDSLHSDLQQGATEMQNLTLSNTGGTSLDWAVTESAQAGFQRAGATDFAPGEDVVRSAVIDPSGAFAYFGTFTAPGKVVKVDLATFERVGSITLATGQNRLISAVIDPAGAFAYFGTTTTPGQIVKIDLATLDLVGALTLDAGEGLERGAGGTAAVRAMAVQCIAAVMDPQGAFAYFAASSTPGAIVKVDLATFTRVGAVALDAADGDPLSGVIDPAGAFAYFGTDSAPGQVVKIDLATFARVGAAMMDVGEDVLQTGVIDPSGAFAYFGTNGGFDATDHVVSVDLATFTRAGVAATAGPARQAFGQAKVQITESLGGMNEAVAAHGERAIRDESAITLLFNEKAAQFAKR